MKVSVRPPDSVRHWSDIGSHRFFCSQCYPSLVVAKIFMLVLLIAWMSISCDSFYMRAHA
jgi:hypothetical protein